ncbi:MAG: hypothetical protein LBB62_06075 [Proteiniphilum sp.]|jgi:hypothetical protein|nr:hypothetical protein [Proteiniphilum sp.]
MLPLSHINAEFSLDGETFDVEHFDINFEQPTDFRGQPQHEIEGGQLTVHISQAATNSLYTWAKTSTLRKSGTVLFQTDLGMTVLKVEFTNAYCINLTRQISAYTGTNTILVISPEKVKLNGIEHDNFWAK